VIGQLRSTARAIGARSGGVVTGVQTPRRRLAGVGQIWSSRLHLGRGQALEVEHDAVNTSRRSRRLAKARVGAPHGEGGAGSRHRGKLACAEGKEKGEGARHGPYHSRML
jgi:hypothetical protein